MVQFKNAFESHQHSLQTLELLYGYDSFLDSLEYIADFGCGAGLDTKWWATLETRDEPPEPRNYITYAVDINHKRLDPAIGELENVRLINEDFDCNDRPISRDIDLIWCHDSFQFVTNPLSTLKAWNKQLVENGMLILIFPQNTHYAYNRLQTHSYSGSFYNHNLVNLMYMLAVNGFDCRDAYFLKEENSAWLSAAVYKTAIEPMNPKITSWYDLADLNLVNNSVMNSLNKYGYVKQDEIVTTWLDKDFHLSRE